MKNLLIVSALIIMTGMGCSGASQADLAVCENFNDSCIPEPAPGEAYTEEERAELEQMAELRGCTTKAQCIERVKNGEDPYSN